jgi:DNA-binding CsgD family transcriptional regulator
LQCRPQPAARKNPFATSPTDADAMNDALIRIEKPALRHDSKSMRTLLDLAIERIHTAGMGDIPWADALSAVARVHNAMSAVLYTPELIVDDGGLWASHDATRASTPALRAVDATAPRAAPSEQIFSCVLPDGGEATMPQTLFALFRPRTAGPLTDDERDAATLTCRHLSLAARLWFRKRAAKHGAETLAAALGPAALLVNRDGHVLWMNRRAGEWVQSGRLALSAGNLAEIRGFRVQLPRAVRECLDGNCPRLELSTTRDCTVEMVAVPMPRVHRTGHAELSSVLIIVRDQRANGEAVAALIREFQLTQSEAELARALFSGMQVGEYAQRRQVSPATVRSQLKALLSKTGSRRQSDVVALLARMQPLLAVPGGLHYAERDTPGISLPSNG